MARINLGTRPTLSRFDRATTTEAAPPKIDPTGGMYSAGVIRGVSVITQGEALGHCLWIDAEFVDQVATVMSAAGERGFKSRFTHPSMCSDGLGKHLGRVNSPVTDTLSVRCDLHFTGSSHESPGGDLASYVMGLVTEDPSAAGLSIAFERDYQSEAKFLMDHGALLVEDDDGRPCLDTSLFKSPDPANVNNYPHARLLSLRAVDVVDEPAANPDGMFDSVSVARDVDSALAFALGLTNSRPQVEELFGVNIDRAGEFLTRFFTNRGLSIVELEATTETEKPIDAQAESLESNEAETECGASTGKDAVAPEIKDAEPIVSREVFAAELSKFTKKFGAENGVDWFSTGKSWEQALELHNELLSKQRDELKSQLEAANSRLSALSIGETNPLDIAGLSQAPKLAKSISEAKQLAAQKADQ